MSKAAFQKHLVDGKRLRRLAQKKFISCIRTGRMIAYVGSYATQALGYRSWEAFLSEEAKRLAHGTTPPEWVNLAIKKIGEKDPNAPLLFDLIEKWRIAGGADAAGREELAQSFRLTGERTDSAGTPYHVVESLGIDRIITTNYDEEFEWITMTTADERRRMIEELAQLSKTARDEYLRTFEPKLGITRDKDTGSLVRHLPDGRSAISDVFDRDRADRLMEFAIGSPDFESHILHLHGRATDPDSLIVSTHDYLQQYRRTGITKLPFEHAQRMLFAGNPVLFVGMGMNEADLTSVLEQFVSDHPHRDTAPAFILWTAKLNPKVAGEERAVSDEDELKRLSWYRRFGALTLFESELPRVGRPPEGPRADMAPSVRRLAKFAKDHVTPFKWKQEHFRSMQERLDEPPVRRRYDIWTRIANPNDLNLALFNGATPHSPGSPVTSIADLCDGEVLTKLFCGDPVKAIIDPPGSGHGLLAKILAQAFTDEVTLLPSVTQTICSVINANFMCEADSAFSLLSGLYDHKTAFADRMSRKAALQKYVQQIGDRIADGLHPERSILVVINGMERFFDTSGHPLSSEVDNAIRAIFSVYATEIPLARGATTTVRAWVESEKTVNPYSIILLGTARVQRYLESLSRRPCADRSQCSFTVLNHQTLSDETYLLDDIGNRLAAANPNKPNLPNQITWRGGDVPPSAYLSAVEQAFEARGCPKSALSIARQTLMAQSDLKSRGDQRHSFMTAYLRSGTLQRALPHARKPLADLCLDILSVLAFVGQPIEPAALAKAPRVVDRLSGLPKDAFSHALEFLVEVRLVLQFDTFPGSRPGTYRYGLHRAVMAELRDRHGVPISDAKLFNGFNLSLFASQPIDDYTPEDQLHDELSGLVDAMLAAAEDSAAAAAPSDLAAYLRTALALMRGYFTTSALLMHEPSADEGHRARLTEHADRLLDLIRLAEDAAEHWSGTSKGKQGALKPRPLFPDDVVWLHNERGVVKLAQGDLYEARISFDQALAVNTDHVEFGDQLQNWRSIQLNQLHVDVERGKISRAESRILEIEKAIDEHARSFAASKELRFTEAIVKKYASPRPEVRDVDEEYPTDLILAVGLVTGYKGFCGLLRGQLKTSQKYFKDSIEILRNLGEQRAYSLLQRNYTSLLFAIGNYPEAQETIRLCISAADSYRQLDISYLARITEIDYEVATDRKGRAHIQPELIRALQYSVNTDMYRVRMEARKTLATVRLFAGDYDGALEHAAEAMSIAARYGFSLRKISLRILIGQILKRRGDPKSGAALLERARRNADRIGYQRGVRLVHQVKITENIAG